VKLLAHKRCYNLDHFVEIYLNGHAIIGRTVYKETPITLAYYPTEAISLVEQIYEDLVACWYAEHRVFDLEQHLSDIKSCK
jgi:hypothetical protein